MSALRHHLRQRRLLPLDQLVSGEVVQHDQQRYDRPVHVVLLHLHRDPRQQLRLVDLLDRVRIDLVVEHVAGRVRRYDVTAVSEVAALAPHLHDESMLVDRVSQRLVHRLELAPDVLDHRIVLPFPLEVPLEERHQVVVRHLHQRCLDHLAVDVRADRLVELPTRRTVADQGVVWLVEQSLAHHDVFDDESTLPAPGRRE